jgi:tetratricopeptide (TPR) repeat protein
MLTEQGKLAEAETVFREALEMRRKLLGNEHGVVAGSLSDLGNVLERDGKLAEAEMAYREALAIERKLFGSPHPITIQLVKELKAVLEREGKQAEADALAEDVPATATQEKHELR